MPSWIASLGEALGKFVKEVLPGLLARWRKPRDVKQAGGDKGLRDDIAKSIENEIGRPTDRSKR